ncbi:class II aldolase/adducin family protein [Parapusillimonas sp. JC17]|uniref:class II aldolase/adducin family protein n=1 Tax=Parapusillimonas sp. JC17 TaxID=3445768 RepID=UPI003F9F654E
MCATPLVQPIQEDSRTAEQRLRIQLAACYRIFAYLGWTELIYNHITVRIPGPDRHFLINPFGLNYTEVTASNLVKIDLHGHIVGESRWKANPAGFVLHSCIHEGIPEAHCIMHTHTTAGCAVACSASGLSTDNFYSAQLHGRLAYHEFEGITVHEEEGPRVVKSIGNARAVILRNHGLLSWGGTIAEAFSYLWTLQRACEIQVMGAALGATAPIPESIRVQASADALQFDPKYGAGQDVFDALVRQVDRISTDYRQ